MRGLIYTFFFSEILAFIGFFEYSKSSLCIYTWQIFISLEGKGKNA